MPEPESENEYHMRSQSELGGVSQINSVLDEVRRLREDVAVLTDKLDVLASRPMTAATNDIGDATSKFDRVSQQIPPSLSLFAVIKVCNCILLA